MKHLLLGVVMAFCTLSGAHAKLVEIPALNFSINYSALKAGEVHYSLSLLKPTEVPADLAALDTVDLLNIPDSRVLYSKVAYIVNKPVQHFNYQNVVNINELKRVMPNTHINKLSERSFNVKVNGLLGHNFKMDMEYDSEIVSTVNDAAIIEAIERARRLDGTLGQVNSTIYRHGHEFSKFHNSEVSITRHYDLDGKATLVITTNLRSIKRDFALENVVKASFLNETKLTVEQVRQ